MVIHNELNIIAPKEPKDLEVIPEGFSLHTSTNLASIGIHTKLDIIAPKEP